ncbi:hypothetical protein PV721_01025 [Streptomyces sp. MB09-01]|uniref:DUF6777 domain-containing protein n=1 Tax=Streptomyces sp. MB09-01 TaxID=3028666 RepID=UPI0029A81CAD|nr:DUF6777 domain-containing protein [Streptomyces sp. MB09-01]MDX3532978.1 hypothetical protein [Streptomyces sp. MB09-01]
MHAPSLPTLRQTSSRHLPAGAALLALLGLFAAGCGSAEEPKSAAGPESQEVYLQPVASAGPDPFTASSATAESAPVQPPLPNPTGQGIRTVNAATPGLYGGTQRLGSCDVEQQVRFLTADNAKARAFAQAADIEQASIPEFLRGLTPVVLRADTRVTNHAFRDGGADGFQSVLQAGTAVLVDEHGMPRVRCGCGNPLASPLAAKGSPVHKGDPWSGYQPNQVVVVEPTPHVINNLVIVNIADNTWIERKRGDDGAQDRPPRTLPQYDPADGIPTGPVTPSGSASVQPCQGDPAAAAADCQPTGPARQNPQGEDPPQSPGVPQTPGSPSDSVTRPQQPRSDSPSDVPSDLSGDVPSNIPSDIPFDLTQPDPNDPGLLPEADGTVPQPNDPYADPYADPSADPYTAPSADPSYTDPSADPYTDPYADPDLQPQPSDGSRPLESA